MIKRELGMSFGSISSDYDTYRLDYPEELVDFVVSKIPSNADILEIGAGTGIASEMFAKRGFSLDLVEPSESLLHVAKKKLQKYKISYFQDSFEKINLPSESFDLVFSAQAFHWIDPDIGFQKVYNLLKEDGFFVVFWNIYHNEDSGILRDVKRVYEKHCPDYNMKEANKIVGKLLSSKLFKKGEKKEYRRKIKITKESYIEMVKTYSWVASLPLQKKTLFLNELKDILSKYQNNIEVPYKTLLCIVKK